jgi:hypothetical protein
VNESASLGPRWLGPALFQFAAGVALAIGVLGVVRSGRDVWLGVGLIVFAAAFALRSVALADRRRSEESERIAQEIRNLGQRLDDATAEPTAPRPGGVRRWVRKVFG